MLAFRQAKISDAQALSEVHIKAVRGILTGAYTKEQLESWAIPKPLESYTNWIQGKHVYVAEELNNIVGFGVLDPDLCEIEALFVDPEIKKGVGRQLLIRIEEMAHKMGIKELSLNASLNAENFYKRSGYEVKKRSFYQLYTGMEIPCIEMVKILKS